MPAMHENRLPSKRPMGRLVAASLIAPLLCALNSCNTDKNQDQDPEETSAAVADDADWVKVDITDVYKRPVFSGPVPVELDNLEEVPPEPVFDLLLPAGATANVALNKPVTSSDPDPLIGNLKLVTDGDTHGGDGHYVELGPGLQWVQIDLKQEHEIFAIHVWHFHKDAVAYIDVVVQISNEEEFQNDDGTSADHVVTIWNSDHDRSSGLGLSAGTDPAYLETYLGRVMMVDGVKGRYVRLYSNGSTSFEVNNYTEVMVYGQTR